MATVAAIRARVEQDLPGALTFYMRPALERMRTGITSIDQQTGGIPKGALSQFCSPLWQSSGKTTLLLSLLAETTQQGNICALVDAFDCFDPSSAAAFGVALPQLLWVRCGQKAGMRPLEQAFKAADILVQAGGLSLIVLDLGNVEERHARKIPLTTWFRFARVVEKLSTAFVILTPVSVAQSCAALTLQLECKEITWQSIGQQPTEFPHASLFTGAEFSAEILRSSARKPVQSATPKFTAHTQWA